VVKPDPVKELQAENGSAEIHRAGAGEPDTDGWYTAKSTKGLFTIRLPGPFQDMTISGQDQGVAGYVHTIAHDTVQKVRFAVIASQRADGKLKDGEGPEDLVESLKKEQSITNKCEVTRSNISGIEFKAVNKSWGGYMRVFRTKDTMYQLVVEYPTTLPEPPAVADVEKFFNSFRLPPEEKGP
jgi:hypothetical protein